MLAALLDWPYASLVNKIEVQDGQSLEVGREIEGGNQEISEIELPCVLSIQTGINEPRYVGIRGIRKVASVEIPVMDAAALGVDRRRRRPGGRKGQARRTTSCRRPGAGAEILAGQHR